MSVSKWAYDPEICDDRPCPGDCDRCTAWQKDNETRTATDADGWTIEQDNARIVTIRNEHGILQTRFKDNRDRTRYELELTLYLQKRLYEEIGRRIDDLIAGGMVEDAREKRRAGKLERDKLSEELRKIGPEYCDGNIGTRKEE